MAASSLSDEPLGGVLDLNNPVRASQLAELEERLHIVKGLLDALGRLDELNKVVQFSSDRFSALVALQHEPFTYSRQQAEAVLDMPVSWQTSDEAERLRAEHDKLLARRARLREHVTDEQVTEVSDLHWFG
jgi:DNA gyrase/topoisomerase IV subunit A